MFDLDPGKLIVIGIVALIAIPSKDLPRVMRALGQMLGKARRMSAEFQGQFMEAMREMEVAELKKEIDETSKSVMAATSGSFDPLAEARKQITSAVEDSPQTQRRVAVPNAEESQLLLVEEAKLSQPLHPEETRPSAAFQDEGVGGIGAGDKKAAP